MLSITHVCLSILSSPSNHGSLAVFTSNRVLLKDRCLKGLLRPHTWNAKKLSGRSAGLKNVPFHGGGEWVRGIPHLRASLPQPRGRDPPPPRPASDLHPHPQRMLSNPQNGLFRRVSLRGPFSSIKTLLPSCSPWLFSPLPIKDSAHKMGPFVHSPSSFSVVVH